eukprot:6519050-Pyramimonas_sp.AAC.1
MTAALTREEQQDLEDQLFGAETPASNRQHCDDVGSERFDDGLLEDAKHNTCIKCSVPLLVGNEPSTPVNAIGPSANDPTVCQHCAELKQLVSSPLEGPSGAVRVPADSDKEWPEVVDCYRVLRNVSADGVSTVPLEELAIQWADVASKKLVGSSGEIEVPGCQPEHPGHAASATPASEPTRAEELHGSGLANGS